MNNDATVFIIIKLIAFYAIRVFSIRRCTNVLLFFHQSERFSDSNLMILQRIEKKKLQLLNSTLKLHLICVSARVHVVVVEYVRLAL